MMQGRKHRALLNRGANAVNVVVRCWRRYCRAKVAIARRKSVYALRAVMFRIGINWRVERKRRAAEKVGPSRCVETPIHTDPEHSGICR